MALQSGQHKHKTVSLKYEDDDKVVKVTLNSKKGIDKQMQKITSKIKNKWKLQDSYKLSINNTSIQPNELAKFSQLLLTIKPPLTIYIIKDIKQDEKAPDEENDFKLKIIYKNKSMNYQLPPDLEEWNDETFDQIKAASLQEFKIKCEQDAFSICRDDPDDPDGEKIDVDEIDDLKDPFEENESNQIEIVLYIRIEGEEDDNADKDEKEEEKVETFNHTKINVKYKQSKIQVSVSDKQHEAQNNLNAINNKIQNKRQWKLDKNYKLSINGSIFEMNDVASFGKILSATKPPTTIEIIQKREMQQQPKPKPKAKPKPVNRELSECFSDKINPILQFHQEMYKKIYAKKQTFIDKNKMQLELFKNVIASLNVLRPKLEDGYNDLSVLITNKIQFWQKYAFLCLIIQNVQTCIRLRIAIKQELYNTEEFAEDLFVEKYVKLREIIDKYHSLHEKDEALKFDNLMIQCTEININVPNDMMPVDPNNDKMKIAKQQRGASVNINFDNRKRNNNTNNVRIYLLTPYETDKTYITLPEITNEWYFMSLVSQAKSQHLWYIDFCIPWNQHTYSTPIRFSCQTMAGYVYINPKVKLGKKSKAFYWIQDEKQSRTAKLWSTFTSYVFNVKTERKNANICIVDQLLKEIRDFKTFNKSCSILTHLKQFLNAKDVNIDA
eukprot:456853_1